MDTERLKIILQEKENLTLEFKEKYTPKIDEDLVAFSNTKGGIILLGVNDNGKILGEDLTNELKAKINTLARNCKPSINTKIEFIDKVVIINILEGTEKPYSCSSGYFRRLDGNSQKMSYEEIKIMFHDHNPIPFEEKITPEFKLENISEDKVKKYLKEANITPVAQDLNEILLSANVVKDNKINNAGILLFAKDVSRFIPNSKIDMIRFKGKDKSFIFDRLQIQDDLLTQFEQALFFTKKHLNIRSEIKGINRKDILEIPESVLRESIANALIHRDYSLMGTNISIEIYDDRILILNPGSLPKGLDKEKFGKVSIRRNELIADLFYRMDKIEKAGTGIQKIKNEMREAGLSEPEFEFGSYLY